MNALNLNLHGFQFVRVPQSTVVVPGQEAPVTVPAFYACRPTGGNILKAYDWATNHLPIQDPNQVIQVRSSDGDVHLGYGDGPIAAVLQDRSKDTYMSRGVFPTRDGMDYFNGHQQDNAFGYYQLRRLFFRNDDERRYVHGANSVRIDLPAGLFFGAAKLLELQLLRTGFQGGVGLANPKQIEAYLKQVGDSGAEMITLAQVSGLWTTVDQTGQDLLKRIRSSSEEEKERIKESVKFSGLIVMPDFDGEVPQIEVVTRFTIPDHRELFTTVESAKAQIERDQEIRRVNAMLVSKTDLSESDATAYRNGEAYIQHTEEQITAYKVAVRQVIVKYIGDYADRFIQHFDGGSYSIVRQFLYTGKNEDADLYDLVSRLLCVDEKFRERNEYHTALADDARSVS